jgi:hypothetical protein
MTSTADNHRPVTSPGVVGELRALLPRVELAPTERNRVVYGRLVARLAELRREGLTP